MVPERQPFYVLGVNAGPHDGSAALLRDGELIVLTEQERFSRRRHAIGESPALAISSCLDHEEIDMRAISCIAVGWDIPMLAEIEGGVYEQSNFLSWLLGDNYSPAHSQPALRFVNHHIAHAASAFYTSGLTEAAIIVADGRGEAVATTVAAGTAGGIEIIRTWGIEQSLGHFYGWAADWAGLGLWGTGKLMGLAAYGRPSQRVPLGGTDDGYIISGCEMEDAPSRYHFALMRSRLRAEFRNANFPFSEGTSGDVMAHANFAASVQDAFDDAILSLARYARRATGLDALVLAGGVGLNCTANGGLIRSGIFDEVWIPPFTDDVGVSLGAALISDRELRPAYRPSCRLEHAYWGPGDDRGAAEALAAIDSVRIESYSDDELATEVASLLAGGHVVGWFQGRAEVGPRALGARSILADPSKRATHALVNTIKGREAWRPLAPAVLASDADQLFDGNLPAAADFMLVTWPVRERARRGIQAAVHVDGSTRPQIVRAAPPRYVALLEAFNSRTGIPALINTSFNFDGGPMVLSADDAINAFTRSQLEVLVLDNLLIRKKSPRSRPVGRDPLRAFSFVPWACAAARAGD